LTYGSFPAVASIAAPASSSTAVESHVPATSWLRGLSSTAAVMTRGTRQAHLEGFDLHVNVWVSANDRAGLERLCRLVLRPPPSRKNARGCGVTGASRSS